jgi:hypothetical protein
MVRAGASLAVRPLHRGGEIFWRKLPCKTARLWKALFDGFYLKPGEKKRTKEALARKRNRKKRSKDIE